MTLAEIKIRCPHCGQVHTFMAMLSGNTFGAQMWSDAFLEAPMLPRKADLTRCGKCRKFFRPSEAENVPEKKSWFKKPEPTMHAGDASFDDLLEAATTFGDDADHEFEFRLFAFWEGNHSMRGDHLGEPVDQETRRKNIERLLEIIEVSPLRTPLRTELMRLLGRFDEALELSQSEPAPKSPMEQSVLEEIREKCLARDDKIFVIQTQPDK